MMIEASALFHDYDGVGVLDVPSFSVAAGETLAVMGASGSGKSTLLHILAGLLTPTSGGVRLDGAPFSTLEAGARDRARGAAMGVVFQDLHLVDALTVRDNLHLALQLSGTGPARALSRAGAVSGVGADAGAGDVVDSALERVGLMHRSGAKPRALSRGEAQRAAIARALVHGPKVILADEPTSALDDANAETVMELLLSHARDAGAALIIATHDVRVRARVGNVLELVAPPGSDLSTVVGEEVTA